jgi:hypothetical protein
MPRRKRVPPKPVPEDTVVIEHDIDEMIMDEDMDEDYDYEKAKAAKAKAAAADEDEEISACSLAGASDDVIAILKRSRSTSAVERKAALKSMCPCKVKREIDPFWVRIVEMCSDPDESVRYQVLHSLCDGSPARIEELVAETVRSFWNDPSDKIKRAARRAYNSWSRGEGINIL